MNLPHIISKVYCEPWSITKPGFDAVHQIVQRHVHSLTPPALSENGTDIFGEPLPKMEIRGGMAIIPIQGTLIQHAGMLEKMCGACSYDDIHKDLEEAAHVVGTETIWLNINSPGGQCVGNQECADHVEELRGEGFDIYAFGDSMVCSAAYNIAAACSSFSCAKSAYVANIGAMMAMLDTSEAYRMQGLKTDLFTSGPLKGAGADGLSLTSDQRAYLQGLVDTFAGMFKDNVRRNRRGVSEADMAGQVVIGTNAVKAGLADEICDTLEDAIDRYS